jgi:YidC/Oxa1 family membrane protein insertase
VLALGVWQALLDAIGWVLARIYDVVPNYGLSIIILTVVIRLVLLPLGIKQIKSMQHMQAIQPKLKELQKKYKNNKQKLQEEQMKLYKEAGVNPLGGCLPLLLQFPILIAMYSVIKPVSLEVADNQQYPGAYQVVNNHLPEDSALFHTIVTHGNTDFLWMNLQCSIVQSGSQAQLYDSQKQPIVADQQILNEAGTAPIDNAVTTSTLDCGTSRIPDTIPYALLLVLMVASTFYQQVQMQRASPPGAQSQQQQTIMRVMPLMFAFFGLSFPAGLVLYWTTSNGFQIGQQYALLRAGHIGPDALERRMAEQRAKADQPKNSLMSRFMDKAQNAAQQREDLQKQRKSRQDPKGSTPKKTPPPPPKGRGPKPGNQLGKGQPPEEQP